ncbi:MAG: ImmA/IrrE family metallo-endopeptidase [Planctomycetota bacterium]
MKTVESAEIELIAARLVQRAFGMEACSVPAQLDRVLEELQLSIAWVDMETVLPCTPALAFLCVPIQTILLDESLHPNESPRLRSRLRFTIAHEIGHWCMHRHEPDIAAGWADRNLSREIDREQEANEFAGALLIPKEELRRRWEDEFGQSSLGRENLLPRRSVLIEEELLRRDFVPQGPHIEENLMFEGAISALAESFEVSPQALRIRAEGMGLITR